MKLKEFNKRNSHGKMPPATPSLGVNFKNGVMHLNKPAATLLGLKSGHQVKLFKDLEDVENWYLEVVTDGGFSLYGGKAHPACRFNAAVAAREMREDSGFEGQYGNILLAGKPTVRGKRVLYGLIISRLKTA
jgi:hypothetical protein